jgi:hypothetical protein
MLFVEQYFVQVSLEARGKLDIEILGAWCDVKNRALRFNAAMLDSVKLGVLEKARGLLQQFSGSARAGGIGTIRVHRAEQELWPGRREVARGGESKSARCAAAPRMATARSMWGRSIWRVTASPCFALPC